MDESAIRHDMLCTLMNEAISSPAVIKLASEMKHTKTADVFTRLRIIEREILILQQTLITLDKERQF